MVKSIDKLKWNSKKIQTIQKKSVKEGQGNKKEKWWLKTNNKPLYRHKC